MTAEIIQFVPRPNPNRVDLNESNTMKCFEEICAAGPRLLPLPDDETMPILPKE